LNSQEKVLFNQQKMVGVIKDHGDVSYHHDTKMEVSHIPGVVSTRKMMESQLLSIIPGYPRYDIGKLGSSIQDGKYDMSKSFETTNEFPGFGANLRLRLANG